MSSAVSEYVYEPQAPSLNILSLDNWSKLGKMALISAGVSIVTSVIVIILMFLIGAYTFTSVVDNKGVDADKTISTGMWLMYISAFVVGVGSSMFALTSFEYWDGCEFKHKK